MEALPFLRLNPALSAGDPKRLADLGRQCDVELKDRNDVVARAGAPQSSILLVASGRLELYRKNREAGTQILVGTLRPPALFGDAEFYAGLKTWGVSARAAESTTLVKIPFKAFDALVEADGRVAASLYRETSARHMLAVQIMQVLALQQVQHKILRLLWSQATVSESGMRTAPLSSADLARALGVNRRTIARNIDGLESRGLIRRVENEAQLLLGTDAVFWHELDSGVGTSWQLGRARKPS